MEEDQGTLPVRMEVPIVARLILDLFRRNKGATFNLYFGDLAGRNLYAVSVYRDRGIIVDVDMTVEMIEAYIFSNIDLLSDPKNAVGVWRDGEESYFDVSITVSTRQEAIDLALVHDQLAICHLTDLEIQYITSV